MKFTIRRGHHRPGNWWKQLRIWRGRKELTYRVMFDSESCVYDFKDDDNNDVNKLFGIGYFWNHKVDSARFGWDCNLETKKINLFAFAHVRGEMIFFKLCELSPGIWYELTLQELYDRYYFSVIDNRNRLPISLPMSYIKKSHDKEWCYHLGPYFGGNKKAPHAITFQMIRR